MQLAKQYITPLEVRLPDGRRMFCDLILEPTGGYDINLGWFWMSLLGSLAHRKSITAWEEELAFLQSGRQERLPF